MICYFHNDLDGRCAAALVRMYYKDIGMNVTLREMNYTITPDVSEIAMQERVYIVDFSFKPDVMKQIEERTKNIVWCDHHITCKDYGYQYAGKRDFTNKGLCGCELTYQYLYPDAHIPTFITLIGDYDSWRHNLKPCSTEFFEGMKIEDTSPTSEIWDQLLGGIVPPTEIIRNGTMAIKYRDAYCTDFRKKYGFECEIEGHKVYAMNIQGFGSLAFGDKMNEYPFVLAYVFDGKTYACSLYSKTIDVSKIAQKYGGGGHAGASGLNVSPEIFQTFVKI